MEILKMLKENRDLIIKEDLEFFEIELATGNYTRKYINECLELIKEIREFRNIKENKIEKIDIDNPSAGFTFVEEDPIPIIEKNTTIVGDDEQKENKLKSLIIGTRSSSNYQNDFNKVIKDYNIQEQFIDKNYVFFKPIEIDELLKTIAFSEEFLEKYFKLLNHKLLAEHQLFSEAFYMKHFNQLDYKDVLKKGKNPWIKKDKRSTKLTVFLKLKGITL